MRTKRILVGLLAAIGIVPAALAQKPSSAPPASLYAARCASCHGTDRQGGQGPSLLPGKLGHGSDEEGIARSLIEGYADKGMPSFAAVLSQDEIAALAQFIKHPPSDTLGADAAALDRAQIEALPTGLIRTEREAFRIEVVAQVGKTFGMAFLPDGRLLVTEEMGQLRIIDTARLVTKTVRDVPAGHPQDRFRRALLDVAIHPDYRNNGWVYLTRGDEAENSADNRSHEVTLLRGRIKEHAWVDTQILARVPAESTVTGRIAFDGGGHLYMTTASDAGVSVSIGPAAMALDTLLSSAPQSLSNPNGKILRYNADGSVPADNPFAATSGAYSAIFSYGHRNPQGLAVNPADGTVWSSEHGPRGGDELNLIVRGHNYGWPVITLGTRDDGSPISPEIRHEGMDDPVINWTPEIAVSAIAFYRGRSFAHWDGDLLVGSLIRRDLVRIVVSKDRAVLQEVLVSGLGRTRALAVSPQGDIYVALELRTQGLVLRLVPAH